MSGSPASRAAAAVDHDAEQLKALGYSSNFERSMSLWENFSLGFTYVFPVLFAGTLVVAGVAVLGLYYLHACRTLAPSTLEGPSPVAEPRPCTSPGSRSTVIGPVEPE